MKRFSWSAWFTLAGITATCAALIRASTADVSVTNTSVIIPWGDPSLTTGDVCTPIGPAWCEGARKQGGSWQAETGGVAISSWYVSAGATNLSFLLIDLNRASVTGDLQVVLSIVASPDAILEADLLDSADVPVIMNFSGNLAAGAISPVLISCVAPLSGAPDAPVIRIRREAGEVSVFHTTLAPLGTLSDESGNSPNPALIDATAGAGTGTGAVLATSTSDDGLLAGDAQAFTQFMVGAESQPAEGGTNIVTMPSGPDAIYVDARTGSDANSGRLVSSASGPQRTGPKATVRGGLSATSPGDALVIRSGAYRENLHLAGRAVSVHIEGNVDLSGPPGFAVNVPQVVDVNSNQPARAEGTNP